MDTDCQDERSRVIDLYLQRVRQKLERLWDEVGTARIEVDFLGSHVEVDVRRGRPRSPVRIMRGDPDET